MSGEAKIKLSVDTSQAQQKIKLIDQQLNELGKGSGIGISSERSGRGIDASDVEKLIISQQRFLDSFTDYMNNSRQNNQAVVDKLDRINESLKKPSSRGGGSHSKSGKSPLDSEDGLKSLLAKVATGATIASAIKGLLSYTAQGATSSAKSEMLAYNVLNSTGLYKGKYDTARNIQSDIGSPYGYNVYDTLGVQSKLIGRTGATSQENLTSDTGSALRTARALSIDEGSFANAFGNFYQTGTYGHGDFNKFSNLFASSILEAGMIGREDEQLSVLESINKLLDQNLTTITESQHESALGLYSMFSSSNQALSGSSGASLVESLNRAITGGGNTMDIALGKYSGRYASLWEFERQKEKGIGDTQNLASIIDYFETYAGLDLNSDTGKYVLQKFLQSNSSDLSTEEIEEIVNNIDKIKSGEYAKSFGNAVSNGSGDAYIDERYSGYDASKLSAMNMYEAESLNAQERIGDAVNEATAVLKDLYNDMPQWLQGTVSGTGSVLKGAGGIALNVGTQWLGGKALDKVFGSGKSSVPRGATKGFTDDAYRLVKAYENGGDVDEILKGMSKNGEVTDDMLDWADELSTAFNTGADDVADDLIKQGYKSFGKGASALGKVGKALPWIGTGIEVLSTGIDAKKASDRGDKRDVASEIGGGVGTIAGGWAGGALGGILSGVVTGALAGSVAPGIGTAIGAVVGLGAGIGGALLGNELGEKAGEGIYDASSSSSLTQSQKKQIQKYYDEVARLYKEKGNNAAQDYTNRTVVPYLNSIGVSTSKTDDYKKDVGKPDFMKDVEKGYFGVMEESSSATDENTSAIRSNTDALNQLYSANRSTPYNSKALLPNNYLLNRGMFTPHAIGADYIPYDGYLAELHKGETVLDAHEANEYRKGKAQSGGGTSVLEIKLSGSIDGMTPSNQSAIVSAVVGQIRNYLGNDSVMNQLAFNNIRVAN